MTNNSIARKYAQSLSGVQRVRITRDGEIRAYGRMPNTNKIGWYLVGWVEDIARLARD